MKGWQIFMHSVRLVMSNLESAFKVSIVLYLVQSILQVYQYMNPIQMTDVGGVEMPMMSGGQGVMTLLLSIFAVIASLWIAVAWHRFVLSGETQEGWVPQWHGSNMLSYLGRSIILGLLVGLAVMVAMIPIGVVAIVIPPLFFLSFPLALGLGAYVFFRAGAWLPAAAMGNDLTLRQAWEATKDEGPTFLVLGILVIAGSIIAMLPTILNGDPSSFINLIYGLVVNWFLTIIGISVLTTVYGHYIEGRNID